MNIFVAKLNYRTSSEALGNLFSKFGEVVSAKVVTDRETGRSKGFGFVEMPNPREAVKAIKGLNTLKVKSQGIRVKAADDKA